MTEVIADPLRISTLFVERNFSSSEDRKKLKTNLDIAITFAKDYGEKQTLPSTDEVFSPSSFQYLLKVEKIDKTIEFGKCYYATDTERHHADYFLHILTDDENITFIHSLDGIISVQANDDKSILYTNKTTFDHLSDAEVKIENNALNELITEVTKREKPNNRLS